MNQKIVDDIEKIKEFIRESDAILITAGAGMGVDSGLPDFRGDEGFWNAYPPLKKLGIGFSQMANPIWFTEAPLLAWAFYGHRLQLYRETVPHEGFKLLLDLIREKSDNYFIFTSNVDGQFQKAGFSKDKIYEVHGSIHHLQCVVDCRSDIWENNETIEIDKDKFEALNVPLCSECNNIVRPNILMFHDWTWNRNRAVEQKYRYNIWKESNKNKQITVIEMGAGTAIPTVRKEGHQIVEMYENAKLLRINPRDHFINSQDGFSLPYGAYDGLCRVLA